MSKVIIFSGKKQSGKDSTADYVANGLREMDHSVGITAFAKPLKEFCMNVLGLTYDQCYGTDEQKDMLVNWKWDDVSIDIRMRYSNKDEEYTEGTFNVMKSNPVKKYRKIARSGFMTAREVMQIFGTDVMRNNFNNNIWALGAINTIDMMAEDYVLVTDARFPNEIDVARHKEILTIRLHRTNYPRSDEHSSETSLDNYPTENYSYYVEAENLDELFSAIDKIMKKENIWK